MGYETFINEQGKETFVHRDVMENHLGRKLRDDEHVHHKDENKRNNDPENLEVILITNHIRLHLHDISREKRKIISDKISNTKIKNRHKIAGVKLNETKVLEIRERLKTKESLTSIGKDYGVDRTTIRSIRDGNSWVNII